MAKKLNINTGSALLLNDRSEVFAPYDAVSIIAGSAVVSRQVYEKLCAMGVQISGGSINIIDVSGEVVELEENTTITAAISYDGCFLLCDGNLIIEDASGLGKITGLYADTLFCAANAGLESVKNVTARRKVVYPAGAKLRIGDLELGEDAPLLLEGNALYWVHGRIRTLDGAVLERLRAQGTTFHCKRLIIYAGLYAQYRGMFEADSFVFVPDGHAVAEDVTLDAGTAKLYGDKLFVMGDLLVPHDQVEHLREFSSLVVKGEATMPVSAAADFKAVGKAGETDLYEGVLLTVNGAQTIGHAQLQSALAQGIRYTLRVNGKLSFGDDVTAQDMDAVACVTCNGLIVAPGTARAALDSKVRELNGKIADLESRAEAQEEAAKDDSTMNLGVFKL